jgi:hypothetical protein
LFSVTSNRDRVWREVLANLGAEVFFLDSLENALEAAKAYVMSRIAALLLPLELDDEFCLQVLTAQLRDVLIDAQRYAVDIVT